MSLSRVKSITAEEDTERRDSFSDRVCDDLCEVILQFLSLEDKLRLECVSKQFQRSIQFREKCFKLTILNRRLRNNFENILIKFKFDEIELSLFKPHTEYHRIIYDKVIEPIIKYCDVSTRLSIGYLDSMQDHHFHQFIEKFGASLSSLFINNRGIPERYDSLKKCCNIEKLIVFRFFPELNEIQFKELENIEIDVTNETLTQLELFLERNSKTIRFLTLKWSENTEKEQFKRLLKMISKLTNLIHLCIKIPNFGLNDSSFNSDLKQIAINCKELKSIECNLLMNEYQKFDELLSPLKQFKRLKRLRLNFNYNNELLVSDLKDFFEFSFKSFKGFESITHLTIYLPFVCEPYPESILTEIDTNLPKLQALSLNVQIYTTDWTPSVLGRLSRLETIKFGLDDFLIEHIEAKIAQNCKKIRKTMLYPPLK